MFWPAYAEWSTRFYWRPDTAQWRSIDLGDHIEFRPLTTVQVIPAADVPRATSGAPYVWLVVDRLEMGANDLEPIRQSLAKALPGVTVTDFSGGMQVTEFQAR